MITMQTNISDFQLSYQGAICDLRDKDEASKIDNAINGYLFWKTGELHQVAGVKKEIACLKKIKRLVANRKRSLPDRIDSNLNTMERADFLN